MYLSRARTAAANVVKALLEAVPPERLAQLTALALQCFSTNDLCLLDFIQGAARSRRCWRRCRRSALTRC